MRNDQMPLYSDNYYYVFIVAASFMLLRFSCVLRHDECVRGYSTNGSVRAYSLQQTEYAPCQVLPPAAI